MLQLAAPVPSSGVRNTVPSPRVLLSRKHAACSWSRRSDEGADDVDEVIDERIDEEEEGDEPATPPTLAKEDDEDKPDKDEDNEGPCCCPPPFPLSCPFKRRLFRSNAASLFLWIFFFCSSLSPLPEALLEPGCCIGFE